MKVYRISKCEYIEQLSGAGAATYQGRWHSKGTYILYTAASPSLALLESVVHLAKIPLSDYCMICLDIPADKIQTVKSSDLPESWFKNPSPDILKLYGDKFIKDNKFLTLKVPSAVMPEENNYLLNPNYSNFNELVKIVYKREILIDERLIKGKLPT